MKELLRAAESGDPGSQFNLGVVYGNVLDQHGHRSPENHAEAIKWLRRAAEQDFPRAQLKLAQFYAEETDVPETVIEACAWFLRAMPKLSGIHREDAKRGFNRLTTALTPDQIDEARRLAQSPIPIVQDNGGAAPEPEVVAP